MGTEHRTRGAGDKPVDARERVLAATVERSRIRGERDNAKGTCSELETEVRLRAANDEVTARERWLQWIEDANY
jgi:hypothetical protein